MAASARRIAEGDVVLIRARVSAVHAEAGLATVRVATAGSEGGPGYEQRAVALLAIASVEAEPPDDPRKVPPRRALPTMWPR